MNLRLYQEKCPKWLQRYSEVATIIRRINQVTYIVKSNTWRTREKIVHVDKLKLKTRVETATDVLDHRSNADLISRADNLSDRLQLDPTLDHPGRSAPR